ncbi:Peptidase family M23 [Micromonospora pattaloongensis]|uniref:Peptidase family M23 n=1 Tax=Micromonospora pattaloongensis TaxID=405436 RepID=A0A1H3Q5S8_9ACTN|nr:M23 family metallopeptidase [Micromonospora pattaloongensis]SDZ08737.1 Peptidase family M23 [Micromonospora pattaloongensis]
MQHTPSPDDGPAHPVRTIRPRRRLLATAAGTRRRRIAALVTVLALFGAVGAVLTEQRVRSGRHRAEEVAQRQARADANARADRAQRDAAPPELKPEWVSPMPGARTTSCFGQRWGVLHAGIDLAMAEDTPIHAAGAGTVKAAGPLYSGYGNSVVIDHGGDVLTHYAHMNKTAVAKGQQVAPGDVIGYEGATGDSTGPHLHFEVHLGALWKQVDPQPWMKARGVDLNCGPGAPSPS